MTSDPPLPTAEAQRQPAQVWWDAAALGGGAGGGGSSLGWGVSLKRSHTLVHEIAQFVVGELFREGWQIQHIQEPAILPMACHFITLLLRDRR